MQAVRKATRFAVRQHADQACLTHGVLQFMVAILKADTDGTAAYQLLVLKELITTMTVRHFFSFILDYHHCMFLEDTFGRRGGGRGACACQCMC